MLGRVKEKEQSYWVGLNKVSYAQHENVHCIVLPSDCIEDHVLNIVDQILIPLGTVTKYVPRNDPSISKTGNFTSTNVTTSNGTEMKTATKAQHHYSPILECINNRDTESKTAQQWTVIRVYLGVNLDYNRLLLVHIISPDTKSSMISSQKTLNDYSDFCEAFFGNLNNALENEHIINGPVVGTDKNTSVAPATTTPVEDAKNHMISQFGITNNAGSDGPQPLPLTIVDLGFIRDLQAAYAQKMILRLTDEAQKIDSQTQSMEFRTAKLMTLLKPSYTRAGLTLPIAPEKTSILSYPLPLTRQTITEPYIADSRLLLLRGRRAFKQIMATGQYTKTDSKDSTREQERQFVVTDLKRQLKEWCVEEHQVRLFRKQAHSRDRQAAIRQYQSTLINTLHQRFNTEVTSSRSSTSKDKSFQQSVQSKFGFISLKEPVIVDTAAIYCNRSGTLYITMEHLLFFSGGLLLSSLIHVIPLKTVASMTLFDVDTMHAHRTLRYSGSTSTTISSSSSSSSSSSLNGNVDGSGLGGESLLSSVTTAPMIGLSAAAHLNAVADSDHDLPRRASQSAAAAHGNGEFIQVVDLGGNETVFEFKVVSNAPENPSRVIDLLDLLIRDLHVSVGLTQSKDQSTDRSKDQGEVTSTPTVTDSLIDFDSCSSQHTTTTTITAAASDANTSKVPPAGPVVDLNGGGSRNHSRNSSNMSTDYARVARYSTDDDYDYLGSAGGADDDDEADTRRIQDTFSSIDEVLSHMDSGGSEGPAPDKDSVDALTEFFSPDSAASTASAASSSFSSFDDTYTDPFDHMMISPCKTTNDESFSILSSGEKLRSLLTLLDDIGPPSASPSTSHTSPSRSGDAVSSAGASASADRAVGVDGNGGNGGDSGNGGGTRVKGAVALPNPAASTVTPKKNRLLNIQKFLEESQKKPVPK